MSAPLATVGERFTAQFIDGIVAFALGAAFFYGAKALGWPLGLAVVGWLLYLLICDAMPGGQSLGKKVTGSSVVHATTGEPCRCWQSVVRNFPILVLGVFDVMFIAGKQRRRLGDYLAKTRVVQVAR